MKKVMMLGISALALVAFMSAPSAAACSDKSDAKQASAKTECAAKTDAKMASASSCDKTNAKLASGKDCASTCAKGASASHASSSCSTDKATMAKGVCPVSGAKYTDAQWAAAVAKEVGYTGEVKMVNMSVKGMTCNGCASGVSSTLAKMDGVVGIADVCYKSGMAKVVVAPAHAKSAVMVKAVVDKGYEAKVMTASAKSASKSSCSAAKKADSESKPL